VKVTISRSIIKSGDKIEESFSVSPKHPILSRDNREVHTFISLLILHMTISPDYKLINISGDFFEKKFTYEFEANKKIPELFSSFSFEYFPTMGQKKCTKCIHYKRFGAQRFCMFKSIKLKGNFYFKCNDWTEKSVLIGDIKDIIK